MTIDELVRNGVLKEVTVQRPSDAVIEAGNLKYRSVFKKTSRPSPPSRMSGADCTCNSICVVEAMHEKGEKDWHIVPGFALNPDVRDPIAHVWVRKGFLHYDPTWSLPCFNWECKDLLYYQLVQHFNAGPKESEKDALQRTIKWGNAIRRELIDLAEEWNLKISGYLY